MKRKHVIIFLIWLALLNWPPVVVWIPFLRPLCSVPCLHWINIFALYLYWVNIPAVWLGLAKSIGQRHYDIQEFGALPQTAFAWFLIAAFWILVAIVLTAATAQFPRLLYRKRKEKKDTSNKEMNPTN
jgi:hypothetical protein